ncbi:hypothetical protein Q0601_15040 [Paracoccus onubensis]|uniref:hypothetical protein n=1 Tax=Paracoccus onubensis TaxID=1675788 RepID=UPI0027310A84|nr:hypothetical protein [Paracoccus onubensis]MDP0928500.1 hypothetical protein [Paracoccus onubensis]
MAERHGWDRTNQGIYVDQQGRIATEWDQAQADRTGMRDAAAEAIAATDAAWNTTPVTPSATVSTKTPALGVQPGPSLVPDVSPEAVGVARELGLNFQPRPAAQPQAAPSQTMAPQATAPQAAAPMGAISPGSQPLQMPDDVIVPPAYGNGEVAPPDTQQSGKRPYEYGRPGQAGQDIRQAAEAAGNTLAGWGEQVINSGVDTIQRVNAPFQAASRWITGEDHIGAPERVDLNNDGQRPTVEVPAGDALFGRREATAPTPKGATPQEAAVSRSAQDAMDRVGEAPSQQATANAMPVSMGATKGKPMTEPQRRKAAKTYTDTWMQVGAPIYQRELLKQGRIDDAKAMDDWMRSTETRAGMEAFSEATFAAMSGDAEKAAEKIIEAYNTTGYFDDGYEIVKEQSELIRDSNGEVVGLKLAMRNQATGEIMESVDEIDDLLNKALYLISPEKAFEAAIELQKAMSEALVKAEAERAAAGRDLIKTEYDNANKAALELFKADQANAALEGRPPITWQEALAAVSQQTPSGASGNVPVLRPQ